jgi:hypothetical protein
MVRIQISQVSNDNPFLLMISVENLTERPVCIPSSGFPVDSEMGHYFIVRTIGDEVELPYSGIHSMITAPLEYAEFLALLPRARISRTVDIGKWFRFDLANSDKYYIEYPLNRGYCDERFFMGQLTGEVNAVEGSAFYLSDAFTMRGQSTGVDNLQ